MLSDSALPPRLLAVWGDPVAHSRSPDLHAAAYRTLGLDWEYRRERVGASGFASAVSALDGRWRGLSLTMPLKEAAFAWARVRDRHAYLTGAANTLVLDGALRGHAWNTDVGGLVRALQEGGVDGAARVRILGSGATAASAVVAAAELGADRIDVVCRRPEAAIPLRRIAAEIGVTLEDHRFGAPLPSAGATISTLPGGTVLECDVTARIAEAGGVLLDVAYSPWPSALAAGWMGAPRLSGLGMLLHQAVLQVRVFVTGDVSAPLPDEDEVVASMRHALVGD